MNPKTLMLVPIGELTVDRDLLMGYSVTKDKRYVKVYDNWVNRLVLAQSIDLNEIEYPIKTSRQRDTLSRLKDFQVNDVAKMVQHDYLLNRNKMGAGKTIELIATCILLNVDNALIVCPKTLQQQWVEQFKKWWPERAGNIKIFETGYTPMRTDILMVNPEKLISRRNKGIFSRFVWDVLAVDEAQMIKNRVSQRATEVKKVPARHRYALTGTPVLKHPDDLYSIFEFLNPKIAGASYWRFTEYFCRIQETFYGRNVAGLTHEDSHVAILHDILSKVSCYNDTSVAQQKEVIHVPLAMDKYQQKLYKQILKIELDKLPENVTIPNGAVKAVRLLQTTGCPRIFFDPEVDKETHYPWGVKFEFIFEMLESNPDLKIVVYSKYAKVVNLLCEFLAEKGIESSRYTGQQQVELRNIEKDAFIKTQRIRVLAGTIDALGTGVDGLQTVCNVCVFIDRDYRPSINEQCEARLHRTGQNQKVLCYYLECEKSIDKHVDKLNAIRSEDLRKLLEEDV